eukprot:9333070-Pyramimonas_sp.AAC.1
MIQREGVAVLYAQETEEEGSLAESAMFRQILYVRCSSQSNAPRSSHHSQSLLVVRPPADGWWVVLLLPSQLPLCSAHGHRRAVDPRLHLPEGLSPHHSTPPSPPSVSVPRENIPALTASNWSVVRILYLPRLRPAVDRTFCCCGRIAIPRNFGPGDIQGALFLDCALYIPDVFGIRYSVFVHRVAIAVVGPQNDPTLCPHALGRDP